MRYLPILLFLCLSAAGQKPIGLLFYDGCEPRLRDSLRCRVQAYFHQPAVVLRSRPLPKVDLLDTGYNAKKLIVATRSFKGDCDRIIAFTREEITLEDSATLQRWGLFGLSMYPENVILVSTRALQGEKLLDRTWKVLLHEAAHTYHVPHCERSADCVMNVGHGWLSELDTRKGLCVQCQWLLDSYKRNH